MEWLTFEGVNWLAVAIAFVASFAFGWWYYSPAGVWNVWKRAAKVSNDDMENTPMAPAFIGTILANLLGVILLAVLMVALRSGFVARRPRSWSAHRPCLSWGSPRTSQWVRDEEPQGHPARRPA